MYGISQILEHASVLIDNLIPTLPNYTGHFKPLTPYGSSSIASVDWLTAVLCLEQLPFILVSYLGDLISAQMPSDKEKPASPFLTHKANLARSVSGSLPSPSVSALIWSKPSGWLAKVIR